MKQENDKDGNEVITTIREALINTREYQTVERSVSSIVPELKATLPNGRMFVIYVLDQTMLKAGK